MKKMSYTIRRTQTAPSLEPLLGVPMAGWEKASVGIIENWHEKSGPIRPLTYFRALYDAENIYVRFDVMDTFVKVVSTHLNDNVCMDSCVEFFIQPKPGPTYFNFEINAGGTMLLYKMVDPTFVRRNGKKTFKDFSPVPEELAKTVEIHHSMPKQVLSPIQEPVAWTVAYKIPLSLFKECLGSCSIKHGTTWRGNFFKCGGSKHFGMWSDVGKPLNFHQPDKFGEIIFK